MIYDLLNTLIKVQNYTDKNISYWHSVLTQNRMSNNSRNISSDYIDTKTVHIEGNMWVL